MKKTINKIIFIFALVILVNIIPTEAKAATINYAFPNGQNVLLTYTMITHYGTSNQTIGNSAFQSDRILLDVSATYTYPQIGSVFYATLTDTAGTAVSNIPNNFPFLTNSTGYGNNSYDHDFYYSVVGNGSVRFTVPSWNGSFYIRVYVTSGTGGISQYIPFTVFSTPAVATTVYWCTDPNNTATCTVPITQNASKETTAITPGTHIKFIYNATDLNQGFTCTLPDGSIVSPLLNVDYPYFATADITDLYSFNCRNPNVLAVSTWLSSVSGTQATVSTLVSPSYDAGTEFGFSYYTNNGFGGNVIEDAYSSSVSTKKIVCPTGSGCMPFYATTISGLYSSSSYYVQSYAKNARGVTLGDTRKFTTQ